MLNINGKLLDKLDENEYYLLSILLNYGKKSHPDNGVLMHRTGWGLQKLQKVKKSLVDKGIINILARFDRKDNARGRASNEYKIKSKLCSKFNNIHLHDFHVIEIQLDENHIHEIQLDDFKLDENHAEKYILKLSIIEIIKLLKDEYVKEKNAHIKNLEEKNKQLQAEILTLKTELEKKEKSCAKKEKHQFPNNTAKKAYKVNQVPADSTFLKNYEVALANYKYPSSWTDELKEAFLSLCESKHEKSKGNFGASSVKAIIRKINQYLGNHKPSLIAESIYLTIENPTWSDFDPQWVLDRKAKQEKNGKANKYDKFKGDTIGAFKQAILDGMYDDDSKEDDSWARELYEESNEFGQQEFD